MRFSIEHSLKVASLLAVLFMIIIATLILTAPQPPLVSGTSILASSMNMMRDYAASTQRMWSFAGGTMPVMLLLSYFACVILGFKSQDKRRGIIFLVALGLTAFMILHSYGFALAAREMNLSEPVTLAVTHELPKGVSFPSLPHSPQGLRILLAANVSFFGLLGAFFVFFIKPPQRHSDPLQRAGQ